MYLLSPGRGVHLSYLFNIVLCEGSENLPAVIEFKNLHMSETLIEASSALKEISGVYCIIHEDSGHICIGSSINLLERLIDHVSSNGCNVYIQRALALF